MEIPVLVRSLKSSILSSTSFQMGKTFWWVVSAAVEQSRRKANMVARGDGKFGPWGWPQGPSKPKIKRVYQTKSVENITWNVCNSLKSKKMTILVETNTQIIFVGTELGIPNEMCGKQNLENLKFLEIWINDMSCGNQYLENICLRERGYIKQKVWKT